MALPVTLSGAAFPDQNYDCKPFKSSGGAFYIIVLESTGGTPEAYKATDPTSSFSAVDTSGNPTDTPTSMWVYPVSDVLHVLTMSVSGQAGTVEYHTFDMSTDTWGTTDQAVASISDVGDNVAVACSIGVRSDGDIVVLYQGESDKDMGTDYSHVVYDVSTNGGSTWAGATLVDPDVDETNYTGAVIVMGASDRAHFFYYDRTNFDFYHRSLSSADSLDNNDNFVSHTTSALYAVGSGVSYVDTQTKIRAPYENGTRKSSVVHFDSGANPTITETDGVGDNDTQQESSHVKHLMVVDGTDEYLLYVGGGSFGNDEDLYYDVNTGSGWGTDTEELDAVTINAISANVYDRSGTKIGYVYDDGGTVKYNEIDLGGGPTSTGTLALLASIVGG